MWAELPSEGLPPPWESIGRPLVGRRGSQAWEPEEEPPKSHLLIKDNSPIRIENPVPPRQLLKASVFLPALSVHTFLFYSFTRGAAYILSLVLFSLPTFPQTLKKFLVSIFTALLSFIQWV